VEVHPLLTPGQEMERSSLTMIHIAYLLQCRKLPKRAYQQSLYRSTLTVSGDLPGVYEYSVSNRITGVTLTNSTTVKGDYVLTNSMCICVCSH